MKTSLQNVTLSYSKYFMIIPSCLYYIIYIGEVSYKWIDMDGFEVKSETERFTVVCSRCCHWREMYKNAWRTCSTIILVLLTNNITSFCHCHCRSLRQMTGCGLTKLHIFQWSSQGGPGVPVTRSTPLCGSQRHITNHICETRTEKFMSSATCFMYYRSQTSVDQGFFFSPLHRPLISGRVYTKAVSHRHDSMTSKPRQNRCVLKGLHETVFARKSKSWCYK